MMRNILCLLLIFFSFNAKGQNHYVVTSANDPVNPFSTVPGELRWAIEQANANPGVDFIDFNIPGIAPAVIQLQSNLPGFSDVVMDGSTQPANGYTGNAPKVGIKGDRNNQFINHGLSLGTGCTVKNLLMYDYDYVILGIGGPNNIITGTVIHSCNSFGILMVGDVDNNILKGNIVGTDNTLSTNVSLGMPGTMRLQGGANNTTPDNNTIGGLANGEANFFYNMFQATGPIDIQQGTGNRVSGNIFINNAKNIDIYSNFGCLGNLCKQFPTYAGTYANGTTTIQGTSGASDFIEIYKTNATGIDAVQLVGTATATPSGQWILAVTTLNAGDRIIATATDPGNNTSEFGPAKTIEQGQEPCCTQTDFTVPGGVINEEGISVFCNTEHVIFRIDSCNCNPQNQNNYLWSFGDGSEQTGCEVSHTFASPGTYPVTLDINLSGCGQVQITRTIGVKACNPPPCTNCIGSFAPEPGKKYVISLWGKEANAPPTKVSYDKPQVFIDYAGPGTSDGPFTPKGIIIDGWQRIEEEFTIPANTTQIGIRLECQSGDCFFDDIRIHPFDASMKTFVFDPVTLRQVAELDERNYATMYEFDEEGKLIRVKKETERGIMTIQENKNSMRK